MPRLKKITPGSELWLFTRITRNPKKKTIHVVQKIKVKLDSPPFVEKKRKYVLVGVGLANATTIEATKKAINDDNKKDCWLEVLSCMETVCGKLLKSRTAGKFAQRVEVLVKSPKSQPICWQMNGKTVLTEHRFNSTSQGLYERYKR